MHLSRKLKRYINSIKHFNSLSQSYSQSGEDLIIKRTLSRMGITRPRYLDIGCNHPVDLNNTYLLYKSGAKGLLVDANPALKKAISKKRKRDQFINLGIDGETKNGLVFYTLSNSALSTFDKNMVAKITDSSDLEIIKEQKIQVLGINDFLNEYVTQAVDFVSIDVEGSDENILLNWDFSKYRPAVFCVETISHLAENKIQYKNKKIMEIFERESYITLADTYINTIFVDKDMWFKRHDK